MGFQLEVEESSEIASARVSSSYRKSIKRRILDNKHQAGSTKNMSLSKISEEENDSNSHDKLQKVSIQINDCHAIFVSDDDKLTSDDFNDSNPDSVGKDKKSSEKNSKQLEPSDVDEVIGDISRGDNAKDSGEMESRKTFPIEIVKQNFLSSRFVPEFIGSNKITIV